MWPLGLQFKVWYIFLHEVAHENDILYKHFSITSEIGCICFIKSEKCNYLCFSGNSYEGNKMNLGAMAYWWSRSQLLLYCWQLIACEIMFYAEYLQNLDFGGARFDCKKTTLGYSFFPFQQIWAFMPCLLLTAQPWPSGPLASLLHCGGCSGAFWEVSF